MSADELEDYEAELEMALLREYRDLCRVFSDAFTDQPASAGQAFNPTTKHHLSGSR